MGIGVDVIAAGQRTARMEPTILNLDILTPGNTKTIAAIDLCGGARRSALRPLGPSFRGHGKGQVAGRERGGGEKAQDSVAGKRRRTSRSHESRALEQSRGFGGKSPIGVRKTLSKIPVGRCWIIPSQPKGRGRECESERASERGTSALAPGRGRDRNGVWRFQGMSAVGEAP